MKNKIFCLLVAVNVMFLILSCNFCFAAEPTVEREYIARRIKGVDSEEERICVDYKNLWLEKGDYLRVLFFDGTNSKLGEYSMDLSVNAPIQNEMSFASDILSKTEYIYIEIIGSDCYNTGITLPI